MSLGTCDEFRIQQLETTGTLGDDSFALNRHSVTLVGNRLYVLGGLTGNNFSKRVFSFDYSKNVWALEVEDLPNIFVPRMMATFLHDDTLWSVGERYRQIPTVWQFDLVTKDVSLVETTGEHYPVNEVFPRWAVFVEGIAQVILGVHPLPEARTMVQAFYYAFKFQTKVWRSVASKGKRPLNPSDEQIASHEKHVYVLSKEREPEAMILFILDVKKEPWIWSTPDFEGIPPKVRNRASIACLGERIFVFGGVKLAVVGLESFDEFDVAHLATSRWDNSSPEEGTGLQPSVVLHGEVPKSFGHRLVAATDRIFVVGGSKRSANIVYEISAHVKE